MSQTPIPPALRERVRQRAHRLCEYCLLHERDGVHAFHVDHVISEKHQGPTGKHNLAFACPFCNRAKGSDIAGLADGTPVRLFNPRIDAWVDHFGFEAERIVAKSNIGAVTATLLDFNDAHRLALRPATGVDGGESVPIRRSAGVTGLK